MAIVHRWGSAEVQRNKANNSGWVGSLFVSFAPMGPQLLTRELVGVACARIDIVIDLLGHLERLKQVVEGVTFSNPCAAF